MSATDPRRDYVSFRFELDASARTSAESVWQKPAGEAFDFNRPFGKAVVPADILTLDASKLHIFDSKEWGCLQAEFPGEGAIGASIESLGSSHDTFEDFGVDNCKLTIYPNEFVIPYPNIEPKTLIVALTGTRVCGSNGRPQVQVICMGSVDRPSFAIVPKTTFDSTPMGGRITALRPGSIDESSEQSFDPGAFAGVYRRDHDETSEVWGFVDWEVAEQWRSAHGNDPMLNWSVIDGLKGGNAS